MRQVMASLAIMAISGFGLMNGSQARAADGHWTYTVTAKETVNSAQEYKDKLYSPVRHFPFDVWEISDIDVIFGADPIKKLDFEEGIRKWEGPTVCPPNDPRLEKLMYTYRYTTVSGASRVVSDFYPTEDPCADHK